MNFQISAALLDACVLAVLSREDAYGYALTQSIKGAANVSESTLYPVLRRLQKDGLLSVYDKPFSGRLRRYYSITEEGLKKLESYREDWQEHTDRINKLLF